MNNIISGGMVLLAQSDHPGATSRQSTSCQTEDDKFVIFPFPFCSEPFDKLAQMSLSL
ncbi:hypothetical protein [Pantoea sp. App145]|uniref:hypothetical protein n=1 Tax=Pantoea sp. App145 TaxID=3071567 RepID=UPI003A808353